MPRRLIAPRRAAPVLVAVCLAACAGKGRPPAAVAADATPVEVTRAFYRALHARDATAAGRLVATAQGGAAAASFIELAAAYQSLEATLRERFGDSAARAVGYAERVAAEERALQEATEAVSGEQATVTAGDHRLAALRRVGGAWRVVLDEALTSDAGLAALAAEAGASRRAVERVAPAIRAGLFDDPEDALEAFRNEVSVAMGGGSPELPRPARPPPPAGVAL